MKDDAAHDLRLRHLIEKAEAGRKQLVYTAEARKADLPLKFLRQQAHFTTPASDLAMVTKAVENGLSATSRILAKFGITVADLSATLEVSPAEIESVLG